MARKPLTRRQKVAFALAVNGGGLVLLLLVVLGAESWASGRVDLPGDFFGRQALLNHTWRANATRTQMLYAEISGVQPWLQTFNAQCWLEDYDVEPKPAKGTIRVFYVGDSFVEGAVPMDRSLPSLVEKSLNASLPPGRRVEVINTGTPSYAPSIEYVLIRYVIEAGYAPDVIVLCIDMTDDFDDWKYKFTAVRDEEGLMLRVPPRSIHDAVFIDTEGGAVAAGFGTKMQLWLFENSHVYNYLRSKSPPKEREQSKPPDETKDGFYKRWSWCREPWDEATEVNAKRTLDLVRDIAAFCEEKGIKLLVTGVPHYEQFKGPGGARPTWSSKPHRELGRVAKSAGAAYLDGQAALAPAIDGTAQSDCYHRGNMHFNERGNRLWAEAHLKALRDPKLGLFPAELYPLLERN